MRADAEEDSNDKPFDKYVELEDKQEEEYKEEDEEDIEYKIE